jgi:acetyltransferase
MTNPAEVARRLSPYAQGQGKPVLASWMGGQTVAEGEAILNAAGIPTFAYPDTAARAFDYMWSYSSHLRALYETPAMTSSRTDSGARLRKAKKLIDRTSATGRTLLTEVESKELLTLYGIPSVPTRVARTADEAVAYADKFGYPIVLKVYSTTITHKTDVGGVQLDLPNAASVRKAFRSIQSTVSAKVGKKAFEGVTVQPMVRLDGYELILGSNVDPVFGPVILFGSGGHLVEVYRDRALALPPLNTTLALRLMELTRIYGALEGVRGRKAADMEALKGALVAFSELVVELPRIAEIDINPLVVSSDKLLALDARVVLADPKIRDADLPHSAIRPYPSQYVSRWKMKDGSRVVIRPIRPEDEPLMTGFHKSLSEESVYLRYFHRAQLSTRVAHERLIRKCFIDYDREMALVAELTDPDTGNPCIGGVARLSRASSAEEAEIGIIVADKFQHQGLGAELIKKLIDIARIEKIKRIVADFHSENSAIRHLAKHGGATVTQTSDAICFRIQLDL